MIDSTHVGQPAARTFAPKQRSLSKVTLSAPIVTIVPGLLPPIAYWREISRHLDALLETTA